MGLGDTGVDIEPEKAVDTVRVTCQKLQESLSDTNILNSYSNANVTTNLQ